MQKLERKFKKVSIKGKEYVEVKERILALVDSAIPYSIETDYQYFPDRQMWVVKAKLTIIETGEVFTWLAQELETDISSMVNKTSALENAETSAVGRACAFAGIWVIDSIASADEVHKAINRTERTVETPTGKKEVKYFSVKDLERCIAEDNAYSKEAIKQWAEDNGLTIWKPLQDVIIHYLSNWDIIAPVFNK